MVACTHTYTHRRGHKRTIPDEAVTTKLRQIGATEPRTNRPIPDCTRASLTVAQQWGGGGGGAKQKRGKILCEKPFSWPVYSL